MSIQQIDTLNESPRHAPTGRLYTADGTAVQVSITQRLEDILLVVLDDPRKLDQRSLLGLTLESTGGRGILRTSGSGQRVEDNLIRFFLDDLGDLLQRREYVRVTAAQPVVLLDLNDAVILKTVTMNLSGGGMLVKRPTSMLLEGQLSFHLYLSFTEGGERISGRGHVIRQVGFDASAIGFTDIGRKQRERLIHFIFDKQRIALAVTRGDAI